MNEPQHAHFVLADAQYCHILEDRLLIGKRELPEKFPEPINKLDYVTFGLQLSAILLMLFFLIMTIIVHYYVISFTISLLLITLGFSLLSSTGFTTTKTIYKSDIVRVDYKKKLFGYDFFVVHYSGPGGKLWKRRLAIYDSRIALDQALSAMKNANLLK